MSLRNFLLKYQYPELVFDYINLRCAVDAGIPLFYVAPMGGGKSVLIQAIAKKYETLDYAVEILERISPMRLLNIQNNINDKKALMVSEDFSTIGMDEGSTEKTVLMVSKLSYDKRYRDTLFCSSERPKGLDIRVKQLSFLCGLQPLWLKLYAEKEVFETIIQEKILRYFALPIYVRKKHSPQEMLVEYLNELNFEVTDTDYYFTQQEKQFMQDALMVQCGERTREYTPKLLNELKKYIPKQFIHEWIRQFAERFNFEKNVFLRYYTSELSIMASTEVFHKEYMVLFNVLAFNPINSKTLGLRCKIRGGDESATRQYVGFLIKLAQSRGFIYAIRHRTEIKLYPTKKYQDLSLHIWRPSKTEKDLSGNAYNEPSTEGLKE